MYSSKMLLLPILWAACGSGFAAESHVRMGIPSPTYGYFSSVEEAVINASNRVNPQSIVEDCEYIGLVLFNPKATDKAFPYTYTLSKGVPGQNSVTGRFLKPLHMEAVALWHTHGGKHWSRKYFSDVDTHTANSLGLPFYMADYKGTLRVYSPGDRTLSATQARLKRLGNESGYAKGQIVFSKQTGRPIVIAVREREQELALR